jgi:hypothetical protein
MITDPHHSLCTARAIDQIINAMSITEKTYRIVHRSTLSSLVIVSPAAPIPAVGYSTSLSFGFVGGKANQGITAPDRLINLTYFVLEDGKLGEFEFALVQVGTIAFIA